MIHQMLHQLLPCFKFSAAVVAEKLALKPGKADFEDNSFSALFDMLVKASTNETKLVAVGTLLPSTKYGKLELSLC